MHEEPILFYCPDTGVFPNSHLPVILYRQVLDLPLVMKARYIKRLFASHQWTNAWNSGVFTYDHYHSITHEVLGFFKGSTLLQLGGEEGYQVKVAKGDVLVIPAGVAHRNLGREFDVGCIGAYPNGREYDINTGQPDERPGADRNIAAVPMPYQDPLCGSRAGLSEIWTGIPIRQSLKQNFN